MKREERTRKLSLWMVTGSRSVGDWQWEEG
jgi:hypothetical protein